MFSIFSKAKRVLRDEKIIVLDDQLKAIIAQNTSCVVGQTDACSAVYINPDNYIPCIIKIAYETTIEALGKAYLDDEKGKSLRKFLYDLLYTKEDIPKVISCDVVMKYDIRYVSAYHQVLIHTEKNCLLASINLFGGLYFSIPVSYDAAKYADVIKGVGYGFIDSINKPMEVQR